MSSCRSSEKEKEKDGLDVDLIRLGVGQQHARIELVVARDEAIL